MTTSDAEICSSTRLDVTQSFAFILLGAQPASH
jgi:hypothetical protein